MARFDILAFDADDTLWHTERLYADAQAQFRQLLARYHDLEWINEQLPVWSADTRLGWQPPPQERSQLIVGYWLCRTP